MEAAFRDRCRRAAVATVGGWHSSEVVKLRQRRQCADFGSQRLFWSMEESC